MIRLLITDNSALMRKLLEGIFHDEGDFDIRIARNGSEALELARSFDPQVVTLDVQMPDMDGLSCLRQMMIEAPRPVVMISSLTEEGTEATLEAMDLGAVDFVAKPGGTISLKIDELRPILVEKVRGAANARIRRTLGLKERIRQQFRGAGVLPPTRAVRLKLASERAEQSPGLVLIGTSTGGPAALDVLLPQLPLGLRWPVMVAQHMPGSFTGAFAKRLDRQCELQVVEVNHPMLLQAGTIYIGKGDADLVVARRSAGLFAMSVPVRRDYPWHPSVERMVESALEHFEASRIVGVLMTGMGSDGAEAMSRLHAEGGWAIAEAESTAVVWGMPGELVRKGGADCVLPIDDIGAEIIARVDVDAVH